MLSTGNGTPLPTRPPYIHSVISGNKRRALEAMGGSTKGRKESCSWSWLNRRLSHLERPVYSPSIMALIFWSLLSNSIHPHTQRLMLSLIAHSSTFLSPSSGPGSASRKTYNWFLQSAHNPHLHSAYADVCIRQNTLRRRKQANQEIFRIANLPVTFFPDWFSALIGEELCFILHFVLDLNPQKHAE